jgi:hypothetical protein
MTDASGREPIERVPVLRARGWVEGILVGQNHLGEGDVLLTPECIEFASGSPFPLRISYRDVEAIRPWELLEPILEKHAKALAGVEYSGRVVAGQASDDHGIQAGFMFTIIPIGGSDVNQWLAELARRCSMAAVYS